MNIQRVGVVGAGTMGAAIAGLLAGAELSVVLLDVPPDQLSPAEQAAGLSLNSRVVRNRFVQAGLDRMRNARPANLFRPADVDRITIGNTADDFALLADCDWVIEVVVEQLAVKQALVARLEQTLRAATIVTTNTSGIPIASIVADCSPAFQRRFFGSHFFNPPRYLKLLELIAGPATDPRLVAEFAEFAAVRLGKGIVHCHDRPNFIGNRLFAYTALRVLNYALDHACRVDDVDALTGPLIGRPSTASFRLLDAVGIDVMRHVTDNLAVSVPDDESRDLFQPHPLLNAMIAAGRLGRKAGQGFYREERSAGQRVYHVLNLQTLGYEPARDFPHHAEVQRMTRGLSTVERIHLLLSHAAADPADHCANLTAAAIYPLLAYAARRLPEIADSVADVDHALRWGFAHEHGPFELWQALGIAETAAAIRTYGESLPGWVDHLISSGLPFYREVAGTTYAYHVPSAALQPLPSDPRAIDLRRLQPLHSTASGALYDLADGVLCCAFNARADLLDRAGDELLTFALRLLQQPAWRALVIGSQAARFALAADCSAFVTHAERAAFADIGADVDRLQQRMTAVRLSPKPVVVAAFGPLSGSAAELLLHGSAVVAAVESAIGLTGSAGGLVPFAGGIKELNRRLIAPAAAAGSDPTAAMLRALETIVCGRVSGSAPAARDLGFLTDSDRIVFAQDHLLGEARLLALQLAEAGYRPPAVSSSCYALGAAGIAAARAAIAAWQLNGTLTADDTISAYQVAQVLCGGPLTTAQWLAEADLLALERAALLTLLADERNLARLKHRLTEAAVLRC